MEYTLVAASAIFLMTYVLISIRRVGKASLERPAVALFGAALMVGLGIVTPAQALESINLNVIILLLGMMLIVAGLEVCGFFDFVSIKIATRARSGFQFLSMLMISTAVLSALVLNDTIVLLMTPIVIKSCRNLRLNPIPYLIGEAISANVGSVATEVGNPQNAFIGIQSGIPFMTYSMYMLPVMVMCLAVAIPLTYLAFRRELSAPIDRNATLEQPLKPLVQKRGLTFVIAIVVWTVVSFVLSTPEWLPMIAMIGGALVLIFLPAFAKATTQGMMRRIDWSILLFFVGLFIVMKGVAVSGLLDMLMAAFRGMSGPGGGLWGLSGMSAILSNLVSNVPSVMLLAPTIPSTFPVAQQQFAWLTLASSSTLAGNATILGAVANVIVVQSASSHGVEVKMVDFMKAGLLVTLVTLTLATSVLWLFSTL